jgi:hypothetical protein
VQRLTAVNFTGPATLLTLLLPHLRDRAANVVVAGSVAAVRPRPRNLVYGAAKRALQFFCEGLRYRAAANCYLQFYLLGYIDTAMMAEQSAVVPKADPRRIAKIILGNFGRDGLFFLPWWWRGIALLFRLAPRIFVSK